MKHITITGSLGSGKSVVSSILKEKLGLEIESIGSLLRKMAQNYGMSTNEFNKYMEEHPEFDHELDSFVKDQGLSSTAKIFDSRLAWHFIPQSFKIYLYVKDEIAAKRIYSDKERFNEEYNTENDALYHISERRKSEILRFRTQYNINLDDFDNYNLIIDTSHSTPDVITNIIIENYKKNSPNQNDIWISPYTLTPTQEIREHSLNKIESVSPFFSKIENYIEDPILIIFFNDHFYIFDGHKRTLNAIKNRISLIPCLLINPTAKHILPNGQSIDSYINDNFSQGYQHDWNDLVDYIKNNRK